MVLNPRLSWLNSLRQQAFSAFEKNGFPSPRAEEWRYTNVAAIEKKRFPLASPDNTLINAPQLSAWQLADCYQCVFVNGFFNPQLSNLIDFPVAITISSLAQALETHPDIIENYLGHAIANETNGFLDFNTAHFSDGLFLHVAADTVLDKPLQIIHVVTQEAIATTRHLVILDTSAQATVIETFIDVEQTSYLSASVLEGFIAEGAQLTLYKLQHEADKAFHFGGAYIQQQNRALFNHHNFALGGLLARSEIHCTLATAAECYLNGLYLGQRRQHIDNHTRIDHQQPQGISREFYKGILNDWARGVFQGRVKVAENAQETDSQMNNRNLLLSANAEIDTKPQLEIYADDVKCAHGMTVGTHDEKSIFYLQSRGMDKETAEHILTFAFANEMVDKITVASLKTLLQNQLLAILPIE